MTEDRLKYLNRLHEDLVKCEELSKVTFPEFKGMYERKLQELKNEFAEA